MRQRSPLRARSPARPRSPVRTRSPPPPRHRSPYRGRSPPRSHRSPRGRHTALHDHRRRHSPPYLPPPPRHHSPPPARQFSPWRHPASQVRPHRSTSPRRPPAARHDRQDRQRSPSYQQDNFARDFSPMEAPRVPRDQRTPPQIQPPRPKHMRSPRREDSSERQSGSSKSSRSSKSTGEKSKSHSDRRSHSHRPRPERGHEMPASPPPPPAISSPESPLLQLSSDRPSSFASTGTSSDWAVFRGPDRDDIDMKELKRIQIDIRRKVPNPARSDQPVNRKFNQEFVSITRRDDEGRTPIFSRGDIKANAVSEGGSEKQEQKIQIKVAPLEEYERRLGGEIADHQDKRWREETPRSGGKSHWETRDVRARLGDREPSLEREVELSPPPERRDVRERLGLSIKDRLGELVRDEVPEYRPRGGQRHFRGGRRGRGRGYRGHGRGSRSDDWKYHDKYQEDELPSSTTD